jgi:hypothetical protein
MDSNRLFVPTMQRRSRMQNASLTGMASSFGTVRGLLVGLSQYGNHPMTFTRPTQAENTTATTAMKRRPR